MHQRKLFGPMSTITLRASLKMSRANYAPWELVLMKQLTDDFEVFIV